MTKIAIAQRRLIGRAPQRPAEDLRLRIAAGLVDIPFDWLRLWHAGAPDRAAQPIQQTLFGMFPRRFGNIRQLQSGGKPDTLSGDFLSVNFNNLLDNKIIALCIIKFY